MQELQINLQNCYGIKKLECKLDFSNGRTFVIYAPNGVMKTSFAKTAKTLFEGKEKPLDQINPDLETQYDFLVEEEVFDPQNFCVIEPYNEKALDSEDNILTLLANKKQRDDYLALYKEIEDKKKSSLSGLKKISGSSNFEKEIVETFSGLEKKNIYEILEVIIDSIKTSKEDFSFGYNDIFDAKGKVKAFLEKNSETLDQYFRQYEKLIQESEFFSANGDTTFGTTEAKILNKSLEGGEYFSVGYGLALSNEKSIVEQNELEQTINNEIANIFADPDLKKSFDKLDKSLDGNAELKKFKKVINQNPELLTRLGDYEDFRKVVWYSFLKKVETGIIDLIECYKSKKSELEKLIQEANKNEGAWKEAIDEFNNRFIDMPFEMHIKNRPDAVLQNETPTLEFSFRGKTVDKNKMVKDILSQGEKRAFYLLNIIFEIKIRKMSEEETLFVIDDIADSFDYKNKYAIVEYLHDLTMEDKFHCLILTHNFDFHRTICSRLKIHKQNRLHAEKASNLISLSVETYGDNPFKEWKKGLSKKNIIALIPFVRNLIEYGRNEKVNFNTLTHLLHIKSELPYNTEGDVLKVQDGNVVSGNPQTVIRTYSEEEGDFTCPSTSGLFFRHIEKIYIDYLGVSSFPESLLNLPILETIFDIVENNCSNQLEDKIILAIATRLRAEEFMIKKISNQNWVDKIKRSQTASLISKCKTSNEIVLTKKETQILDRVNIITPENIHLNSFMYEPILDMGIEELKDLYNRIKKIELEDQ